LLRKGSASFLLVLALAACRPSAAGTTPTAATTATRTPAASATLTSIASPLAVTATGTLAPAPRAFTQNFDVSSPYWEFLQIDNGPSAPGPAFQAGSMVFDLPVANQWTADIYAPQEYADVRVEARMEFAPGGKGAAGIICRYGRNSGWYEFNIYPDQSYTLLFGQWLAEGVARYTPLIMSESEKIQGGVNEIGLWCEGNILTPYVNGTQLRKRQEKAFVLTSGEIGVTAASFEDLPVTISYDWVQVSEP
jgi:hypothetical protein